MVLETTNINNIDKQAIADLVGSQYSFFKKLKLKGAGSQWMQIQKISPSFKSCFDPVYDMDQGKIELRPNGVVVRITSGPKKYTWAIPFYQLVIYKTKSITIHAQGRFIQFGNEETFKENKSFFGKLLSLKAKHATSYSPFNNI